ncbi:MAG: T9SS type A sorting domain-containing protein, partial [Bacteroidota bacterium]
HVTKLHSNEVIVGVNNSAMGLEEEDGNLNLVITETVNEYGERLVQFRSAEYTTISAYQFDIWFDQYQMELVEVIPGSLPGLNETYFGKQQLSEGVIKTLWFDPTGNVDGWELQADEILFTLRFSGDATGIELQERVQTNVSSMRSVGYTNTGAALEIHSDYRTEVTTDVSTTIPAAISLVPVAPNPFREQAIVRFSLPEAAPVEMEVRDLNGKRIWFQQNNFAAGDHQLRLDANEFPNAGLYYLVFRSGTFVQTQKIIFQP